MTKLWEILKTDTGAALSAVILGAVFLSVLTLFIISY
jgi:hypothetical protein